MLKIKEEHVTTVFGVPIVRKCIYTVCDAKGTPEYSKPTEIFNRANIVVLMLILVSFVVLLKYPPQVVDNLINVVLRSCPEKLELDKVQQRLDQYASNLKITSDSLTSCSDEKQKRNNDLKVCSSEKEASGEKLNEAKSKTSSLENSLAEGERNIERLERSKKDLHMNVASLTEEKDNLRNKVDDTEVMLGNCRNKNMDHELEKSEILRKLQKAERELNSCH